uniref:Uncharacterized protein n=1 Tax=Anguilla anguilla TaxID=7936 RepID=A0A0E9PWV1_ANGAN
MRGSVERSCPLKFIHFGCLPQATPVSSHNRMGEGGRRVLSGHWLLACVLSRPTLWK